jgi:hypothetical protein
VRSYRVRPDQSLVSRLVFHARRERDLVRLAMAFKLHKRRWGSHATLVAAGLSSYLQWIDWDLRRAEGAFRAWHEAAKRTHDKPLLILRSTQVKELADLVLRPRMVTLRAAPDDDSRPAAPLLPQLAARGLLYGDVRILAREAMGSPVSERLLPDLISDDRLWDLYRRFQPELDHVTEREYLEAVEEGSRYDHPDALHAAVLEHWEILARIGSPATPLAESAAGRPLALGDDDGGLAFLGKGFEA